MRQNLWKAIVACAIAISCLGLFGCGSSVDGTYTSTSGTMILELRSAGKAAFTMMGETKNCGYTVNGKNVHLTCGGDQLDFHIMDDGSLTSTSAFAAATFGVLKKSK